MIRALVALILRATPGTGTPTPGTVGPPPTPPSAAPTAAIGAKAAAPSVHAPPPASTQARSEYAAAFGFTAHPVLDTVFPPHQCTPPARQHRYGGWSRTA